MNCSSVRRYNYQVLIYLIVRKFYCDCVACVVVLISSCSDIEKVHDGMGANVSIFIQWVSTFVAGFIVGFYSSWILSLLLLGLTPFIVAPAVIFHKVYTGSKVQLFPRSVWIRMLGKFLFK